MKHATSYLSGALVLTAVLGGGCLSLKPQPELTRFYVLESPEVTKAPEPNEDLMPIFLGRVEVPDYLQNQSVAIRLDSTEVHYSSIHYWAEPLSEGSTRVLRDALTLHCGSGRVHPAHFRRPAGAYLDVQVALSRFECLKRGTAVLQARWTVHSQPGAKLLAWGEQTLRHDCGMDADDYRPGVRALSLCLADLGAAIGEACGNAPDLDRSGER